MYEEGQTEDGRYWIRHGRDMVVGNTYHEAQRLFMAQLRDNVASLRAMVDNRLASLSAVKTEDATSTTTNVKTAAPWHVVLYNDNVHSFDQVIGWLQECCGHNIQTATMMAFQVDGMGKAIVFHGEKHKCNAVCQFLRSRGLQCEIDTTGSE